MTDFTLGFLQEDALFTVPTVFMLWDFIRVFAKMFSFGG
jgi:hypothetical protein